MAFNRVVVEVGSYFPQSRGLQYNSRIFATMKIASLIPFFALLTVVDAVGTSILARKNIESVTSDRDLQVLLCQQGGNLQHAFYVMYIRLYADADTCSPQDLAGIEEDFTISLDQYVTTASGTVPAVTFVQTSFCTFNENGATTTNIFARSLSGEIDHVSHRNLAFVYRFVGSGKCRYVLVVAGDTGFRRSWLIMLSAIITTDIVDLTILMHDVLLVLLGRVRSSVSVKATFSR